MRIFLNLAEAVGSTDMSVVPEGTFDKLMYGLNISLIGMLTVFVVLALIMGVLYLFRLVFYTIPNRKKSEAESSSQQSNSQVPVSVVPANAVSSDDEMIPVVIAAAVAAYMDNNEPKSKYRIRSFKRL